jgi:polyphosphate kinase
LKVGVQWFGTGRADLLRRMSVEQFALMRQSGCYKVNVGAESGSPEVLESIKKGTLVEEVIEANIHSLFPNMHLSKGHLFRVTRDADVEIRDDKAADLLALIKESLRERRFGLPVRLEVSSSMPRDMVDYLTHSLRIEPDDVYEIDGLLDVQDLMELYGITRPAQGQTAEDSRRSCATFEGLAL